MNEPRNWPFLLAGLRRTQDEARRVCGDRRPMAEAPLLRALDRRVRDGAARLARDVTGRPGGARDEGCRP